MTVKISRRQALKALLVAAGGLTAAAFLPEKWLKPMVSSGVLPVHARASAYSMHAAQQLNGDVWVFVQLAPPVVSNSPLQHLASPSDNNVCVLTAPNVTVSLTGSSTTFNPPLTYSIPRSTTHTEANAPGCVMADRYYALFEISLFQNPADGTFDLYFSAPGCPNITLPLTST